MPDFGSFSGMTFDPGGFDPFRPNMEKFAAAAEAKRKAEEEKRATGSYGRGFYSDPEGLAQMYRQMGGEFLSDKYAYKPDTDAINNAAAQQTAQLMYSMAPGDIQGMGGAAALQRRMQASAPILQSQQAALMNERQKKYDSLWKQAESALTANQLAGQEYMNNKNLQLNWDQFTENMKLQNRQLDAQSGGSGGIFGDILGAVGGALLPGIGNIGGKVIGEAIFGG